MCDFEMSHLDSDMRYALKIRLSSPKLHFGHKLSQMS